MQTTNNKLENTVKAIRIVVETLKDAELSIELSIALDTLKQAVNDYDAVQSRLINMEEDYRNYYANYDVNELVY